MLNAVNEVAVAAFLARQLSFTAIAEQLADSLDWYAGQAHDAFDSLTDVLALDSAARQWANQQCQAQTA